MGNLRVAVCDDEPMDLVQTITLIQQYDTGKCFDIFSYTRAADLLKIALEKPFDVVLLDIEMETPNGYEIAKKLVMLPASAGCAPDELRGNTWKNVKVFCSIGRFGVEEVS